MPDLPVKHADIMVGVAQNVRFVDGKCLAELVIHDTVIISAISPPSHIDSFSLSFAYVLSRKPE